MLQNDHSQAMRPSATSVSLFSFLLFLLLNPPFRGFLLRFRSNGAFPVVSLCVLWIGTNFRCKRHNCSMLAFEKGNAIHRSLKNTSEGGVDDTRRKHFDLLLKHGSLLLTENILSFLAPNEALSNRTKHYIHIVSCEYDREPR